MQRSSAQRSAVQYRQTHRVLVTSSQSCLVWSHLCPPPGETTDAAAARRIADAIVVARQGGALPKRTKEFAALVAAAKGVEYQAMHPAKLTFQVRSSLVV